MANIVNLFGVQTLQPTIDNNFSLVYNSSVRSENVNEVRLLVDTSLQLVPQSVNIYLPPTSSFQGIWTMQIYVVDKNGMAGTFPINIIPTGGDNINGSNLAQVTNNNGNVVLTIASLGCWTSYGTGGSGGGSGGGVILPYSQFYNLLTNGQLVGGQTYRINDYRSVNFVNGYTNGYNPPFTPNRLAGTIDSTYTPAPLNANNNTILNLSDDSLISANQIVQKYDSNGVEDVVFKTNFNQIFNLSVLSLAEQTDGKILVGGNFTTYGATTCGNIARFNADGTFDTAFSINTGTGFNGQITSIVQLASGKILVGGFFTQFNGNPIANHIACLNINGTFDNAFNLAMGTGFNSDVRTLFEQADGNILIGGYFTSLDVTPSNFLIRIDPLGVIDGGFVATLNFAGGLNSYVNQIIEQPDTNILLIGDFTFFNGFPYNRICRIDTFGNDDFIFNANTGTGFDNITSRMALQNDGSIVIIGSYTSFNSNDQTLITRLDSFGNYDPNFISVFPVNSPFDVCLKQSGNIIFANGNDYDVQRYIFRLFANPQPTDFNSEEIYTSNLIETLVVRALDEKSIEQNVYSEQYPQDIIEYNPQVNKIGLPFDIYNGVALPDSTIVSGFDLQWDGTNVYFDMPTNYPVLNGQLFYLYCAFTTGSPAFADITLEPVNAFGINKPFFYTGKYTSVKIVNNQTRVILLDFTFIDFNNYVPNSLYVDAIYELGDAYGCITKRYDTIRNNTIPYDFRGVKVRRYQTNYAPQFITGIGTFTMNNFGVGFYDCYPNERGNYTGLYKDFGLGSNSNYNFENITWNTSGGANCGYYFLGTDYLVVLRYFTDCQLNIANIINTTMYDCTNNQIVVDIVSGCLMGLTFNEIHTYNFFNNNIWTLISCHINNSLFANNTLGGVNDSTFSGSSVQGNQIGTNVLFSKNIILEDWINNSIGSGAFQENTMTLFKANTIFGDFTFNQMFYWENNIIDGGNLNNNKWRYGSTNVFVSSNFNNNSIETGSFNDINSSCSCNIIDVIFNQNIINNQFNFNSIGSGFQRNQINADFQYNTFLEEAVDNIFNTRFYDNRCGSKFSNNNITGFVEQNNFGTLFNGNNINANQFYNNNFIGRIQANNWRGGTINVFNNLIATECSSNVFEGNTMYSNSISGFPFNGNNIGGAMFNNNIIGGMTNCITGAGSTFQKNTINDLCNGIDFTPATFVYGTLNCTLQEGNLGNTKLSYLDEGTNTYIIVLPTA